ncbi:hypothetical protein ACOMHN_047184 [Nucella lapillus]
MESNPLTPTLSRSIDSRYRRMHLLPGSDLQRRTLREDAAPSVEHDSAKTAATPGRPHTAHADQIKSPLGELLLNFESEPVAGRYGGRCTVAGSKCEVDHSVCSAEATCECTPPYTPNQVFECVVIGVVIAGLAFCMLLGMLIIFVARQRNQKGDLLTSTVYVTK